MLSTRSVVLVEDDPDVARVFAHLLASVGASVRHARTADEAIAAALEARPDAMVVDAHLPSGQCCAIRRSVRAIFPDRPVPVVALCGASGERAALARRAAAPGLVRGEALVAAVAHAIELRDFDHSSCAWLARVGRAV